MKSKGEKIGIRDIVMLMKPMLISILIKTNYIGKSLIAKAYTEE